MACLFLISALDLWGFLSTWMCCCPKEILLVRIVTERAQKSKRGISSEVYSSKVHLISTISDYSKVQKERNLWQTFSFIVWKLHIHFCLHSLSFLVVFKNWGLSSLVVNIKHGYFNIFAIKRKHNITLNFWTELIAFRQFGSQNFYSAFLWNSCGMNTWLTTRIIMLEWLLEVLQNSSNFFF